MVEVDVSYEGYGGAQGNEYMGKESMVREYMIKNHMDKEYMREKQMMKKIVVIKAGHRKESDINMVGIENLVVENSLCDHLSHANFVLVRG